MWCYSVALFLMGFSRDLSVAHDLESLFFSTFNSTKFWMFG